MPEQERQTFDSFEPWLGSFLNLDKPTTVTKASNETPRFSANFEIDASSPEIKRLKAAIVAAAQAKWPNLDVGAAIQSGDLLVPLSNGDVLAEKAVAKSSATGKERKREWSRGKTVLVARSKDEYPPALTIRENGRSVALESPEAKRQAKSKFFYTGVNVLFGVRLNAYDAVGPGKPGVNAYLEAVESFGTGEKLIAQRDPTERFSGYQGIESQEDPRESAGSW